MTCQLSLTILKDNLYFWVLPKVVLAGEQQAWHSLNAAGVVSEHLEVLESSYYGKGSNLGETTALEAGKLFGAGVTGQWWVGVGWFVYKSLFFFFFPQKARDTPGHPTWRSATPAIHVKTLDTWTVAAERLLSDGRAEVDSGSQTLSPALWKWTISSWVGNQKKGHRNQDAKKPALASTYSKVPGDGEWWKRNRMSKSRKVGSPSLKT